MPLLKSIAFIEISYPFHLSHLKEQMVWYVSSSYMEGTVVSSTVVTSILFSVSKTISNCISVSKADLCQSISLVVEMEDKFPVYFFLPHMPYVILDEGMEFA